ncbi:MAG TPA: glycosyltransferase, partial [Planctomycetota bacterium]|nr:glycosyltransferase [Planctomycetota bacterium]
MTAVPAIARASVCIPTHNGARTIGRLLRAVLAQATPIPYDVLVVDTESADGTREIVRSFPVRIRGIHRDEFDHGDTRNLAASLTTGDAIVFLTQDAIPADDQWLAGLLSELEDPRVAGAYSRNLPPPGSSPLVRLSLERDPCGAAERRVHERNGTLPADPTARRLLFDFNNVSSCVRRAAWERFPFPRTSFGEDVLWARGVIESGSRIVFAPGSRVFHGHDDPPAVAGERARVDGRFNALHLGRVAIASLPDALRLGARLSWHDAKKVRSWRERVRAPRVRLAQTFGLWRGGRVRARAAVPRFLERSRLRVLYVVHGFPPESFAGTEVYARQLALAMAARGHDVGVFYRSGAGDLPDLALEESEREGIRHFRVGHALAFRHAGESYAHETVEARFAEALDRFRPEVVHFQHLIHLSARLVGMARERG